MQQISAKRSASYNALLSIRDAHRALHERGGEEAVGKLLSIIADEGLESTVGIRLLHKHNDISDNELMLETAAVDEEGFTLVTAAVKWAESENAVCNSWQLTERGYMPIEFSDAKLVSSEFRMSDHGKFLSKITDTIMEVKMADILGPCLNYSEYVAQHAPSEDAAFLEKTDFDNRANVVRYVLRSDAEFNNSAKTKWHAKRVVDPSGKIVWMTACNCFCSVPPQGGHTGTKTHR